MWQSMFWRDMQGKLESRTWRYGIHNVMKPVEGRDNYRPQGAIAECAILPVLDESNSSTLFTETLTAQIQTVFAD